MAGETYQKVFNSGVVTLIPPDTTPTPVRLATLGDVTLEFNFTIKELKGSKTFAEDLCLADGKITGKAKNGRIHGGILAAVAQGMTETAGQLAAVYDERQNVPAASTYTITVAKSEGWVSDQGVIDITTGLAMLRVASGPTTGQYSVADGVYTFAAADAGHTISFQYAYTLTTGRTYSLSNTTMGSNTKKYQVHLFNDFEGVASGFKLYAALFPKLSMGFKLGDYLEQDLDFQACAAEDGKVIDFFKA